ncbi:MAG: hypothetical protein LBK72_05290 [Bifidobacteriaceae bacterium]|jgi:hypothetical protein|nr:hypothetical protein [Bifidobacteriaceae bacterium]
MPAGPDPAGFKRLLAWTGVWTAVVLVGGMGAGVVVAGAPGLLAGAIAASVVGFFSGSTVAVMAATMSRPVATQSAWLVSVWIVKMLVLLGVFVAIDAASGIDRRVLGVSILIGVLGCLVLDVRLVLRARMSPGD